MNDSEPPKTLDYEIPVPPAGLRQLELRRRLITPFSFGWALSFVSVSQMVSRFRGHGHLPVRDEICFLIGGTCAMGVYLMILTSIAIVIQTQLAARPRNTVGSIQSLLFGLVLGPVGVLAIFVFKISSDPWVNGLGLLFIIPVVPAILAPVVLLRPLSGN